MPIATIAAISLALASAWRAVLILDDCRRIRRRVADQRVYRPELGWTTAAQLASRRRWARVGLAAATGLVAAQLSAGSGVGAALPMAAASILACGTIIASVLADRRLHHARYTAFCVNALALAILLYHAGAIVDDLASVPALGPGRFSPALLGGVLASVFAGQLYLVAGIRKLRSPQFMNGRVLVHNVAYGVYLAWSGNRDFLKIVSPRQLSSLLGNRKFLAGCRLAAILTAAAELALGLGAVGLLPVALTFGLAIPTHLAFTLITPRRIMPFTLASLGLLALATLHPLFRL